MSEVLTGPRTPTPNACESGESTPANATSPPATSMLVAAIFGSRRWAASIERRTPSIALSRIASSIRALLTPYGVALFDGDPPSFARDDENETVPETYNGVDDPQHGGCPAVVATAVEFPSLFVKAMQSASEPQVALFGFVVVN
ncbi:MAG: hypothetical protein WA304_01430 [Candidatus Cybelea sp.]